MPSVEKMMEMLATLVLFALIAIMLLSLFEGYGEGEISFGHAYPVTQKLVSMVNLLSASPQNESAILTIKPFKFKVTFDCENNYIESEVDFVGKSKYGLYVFSDINLIADDIDCLDGKCAEKKILIDKKVYDNREINITVSEIT